MGVTVLIARYLGEKRTRNRSAHRHRRRRLYSHCFLSACSQRWFSLPAPSCTHAGSPAEAVTPDHKLCSYLRQRYFLHRRLTTLHIGDFADLATANLRSCSSSSLIVNIVGDLVWLPVCTWTQSGRSIWQPYLHRRSALSFAVVILFKSSCPSTLAKNDLGFNSQCSKFLSIGLPSPRREFLTQVSFLALCAFVNRLGLQAFLRLWCRRKIVNFAMLIPSSLMQSMASFVSPECRCRQSETWPKIHVHRHRHWPGLRLSRFLPSSGLRVTCSHLSFFHRRCCYPKRLRILKGLCQKTIATAVLFSMIGYFNGNNKTLWVMLRD